MRTLTVHTLGCKINQFDGAAVGVAARAAGYRVVPGDERADVVIINTCTVTGRAEAEGRRLVGRLRRRNPGATIVMTGCHAQVDPKAAAAVAGVDLVVGTLEKDRLVELLTEHEALGRSMGEPLVRVGDPRARRTLEVPRVDRFGSRARAFVKVQDGCNAGCAFCVIPRARGRSRSAPIPDVLRQIEAYHRAGYREVVLAGIHLGAYGRDLAPRATLAELLAAILDQGRMPRVRVSSIEPTHATDALLDLMAGDERVCPHFHLPLQSGSDAVLRRMRRGYTAARYRERVDRIFSRLPGAALGLDVIAGFPGETDADHALTERFIDELPAAYLHVFPFSPRPGTRAAEAPDALRRAVVTERAERLRALGERKRAAYLRAMAGRPLRVLLEGPWGGFGDRLVGTARNYVPVAVRGDASLIGLEVEVRGGPVREAAAGPVVLGLPLDSEGEVETAMGSFS